MSVPKLRLVYGGGPERSEAARTLASIEEAEPLLQGLLAARFNGEVLFRGQSQARCCLYDGTVAWIRVDDHPEHLGAVMKRELGLSQASLGRAIAHCRDSGLRFGEGLVALGLVQPAELRSCLFRHISDQLWELLTWAGPVTAETSGWLYRYDHAFTFSLAELMVRPTPPSPDARARLEALVQQCRQRLPSLEVACVIEEEEGTLLHPTTGEERATLDLLGLCTAGLHRLVANRVTRHDGEPRCVVADTAGTAIVVTRIPWYRGGLLVLGGRQTLGRLISVANSALER
ncbi:MAG: hypothetical protein AAF799_48290 [Myxococcota bacterium]